MPPGLSQALNDFFHEGIKKKNCAECNFSYFSPRTRNTREQLCFTFKTSGFLKHIHKVWMQGQCRVNATDKFRVYLAFSVQRMGSSA